MKPRELVTTFAVVVVAGVVSSLVASFILEAIVRSRALSSSAGREGVTPPVAPGQGTA